MHHRGRKYPALYRPPYGAYNNAVLNTVAMPAIMWSVDTLDWKTRNPSKTLESVKKDTRNGSIILMHDIHAISIDAAAEAIDYLHSEGYRLVTVSELCDLLNRTPDETVIYTRSTLYSN